MKIYKFILWAKQKKFQQKLENNFLNIEKIQSKCLNNILNNSKNTQIGKRYKFRFIKSIKDYQEAIPVTEAGFYQPFWQRISEGEQDLLFPQEPILFVKTSGTVKEKYIPISKPLLKQMLSLPISVTLGYANECKKYDILHGKLLTLGSVQNLGLTKADYSISTMAGALAKYSAPKLFSSQILPPKHVYSIKSWDAQVNAIAESTINEDVRILGGPPGYLISFLKTLKEKYGHQTNKKDWIKSFWPNLQLIIISGASAKDIAPRIYDWIGSEIDVREFYLASESPFAFQYKRNQNLYPCIDDIFYEFQPVNEEKYLTLSEVELNTPYYIIITNIGGLYRYKIGDIVEFTSKKPLQFKICGRKNEYISIFDEHYFVDHIKQAVYQSCTENDCQIVGFTAIEDKAESGNHCYKFYIEFSSIPKNIDLFVSNLDQQLCKNNIWYFQFRNVNHCFETASICILTSGTYDEYLSQMIGQPKIPYIADNKETIEKLLAISEKLRKKVNSNYKIEEWRQFLLSSPEFESINLDQLYKKQEEKIGFSYFELSIAIAHVLQKKNLEAPILAIQSKFRKHREENFTFFNPDDPLQFSVVEHVPTLYGNDATLIAIAENINLKLFFKQMNLSENQIREVREKLNLEEKVNFISTGKEHVAIIYGNIDELRQQAPLVRVHSSCKNGELLGSLKCECGQQLHASLDIISRHGGMLVLTEDEGRGHGEVLKINQYVLHQLGIDTYTAGSLVTGLVHDDIRRHGVAIDVCKTLGFYKLKLITNHNIAKSLRKGGKVSYFNECGCKVEEVISLHTLLSPFSKKYIDTKIAHGKHRHDATPQVKIPFYLEQTTNKIRKKCIELIENTINNGKNGAKYYDVDIDNLNSYAGQIKNEAKNIVQLKEYCLIDIIKKTWPDFFSDGLQGLKEKINLVFLITSIHFGAVPLPGQQEWKIEINGKLFQRSSAISLCLAKGFKQGIFNKKNIHNHIDSYTLENLDFYDFSNLFPEYHGISLPHFNERYKILRKLGTKIRKLKTLYREDMFAQILKWQYRISDFVSFLNTILADFKEIFATDIDMVGNLKIEHYKLAQVLVKNCRKIILDHIQKHGRQGILIDLQAENDDLNNSPSPFADYHLQNLMMSKNIIIPKSQLKEIANGTVLLSADSQACELRSLTVGAQCFLRDQANNLLNGASYITETNLNTYLQKEARNTAKTDFIKKIHIISAPYY